MKNYVIIDLDGTIVGTADRDHFRTAGDWDAFHQAGCESDDCNLSVKLLITKSFGDFNFVLLTGRNEKFRQGTVEYLRRHELTYFDHLIMRPDNDFRPDIELKIGLLEDFFGSKKSVLSNVAFCLDDRQKVIDGFREYGLDCWEVNPGGY